MLLVTPQLQAGHRLGLSSSLLVQPIPIPARFAPQLLSPLLNGARTLQSWALSSSISCHSECCSMSSTATVPPLCPSHLGPATGALRGGDEQETKAHREVLALLIPQTPPGARLGCPREPPCPASPGQEGGQGLPKPRLSLNSFHLESEQPEPGWHQP